MATAAPIPARKDRTKRVAITLDRNGNPQASPDPIALSKGEHEGTVWVCSQQFSVTFAESPFYEKTFDQDKPFSGEARRDVKEDKDRRYKYTVTVLGKSTDPEVIIDK